MTTTTTITGKTNFSTLMEESYQKVFNMAYRLAGNRQDAEDLTQEACYRAFRSFEDFEGDRPFTNWIFKIVTRLYLDLRRTRSRRVSEVSLDAPVYSGGDPDLRYEPADNRANPEFVLMESTISEEMQAALDSLSPEQRELVAMVDLADVKRESVADSITAPVGTVRSRLHRAHKRMRDQLLGKHEAVTPISTPSRAKRPVIAPSNSGSDWLSTSFINLAKTCG
jgi:RNA polymerase sigma-70 factor (ECF subfamily)